MTGVWVSVGVGSDLAGCVEIVPRKYSTVIDGHWSADWPVDEQLLNNLNLGPNLYIGYATTPAGKSKVWHIQGRKMAIDDVFRVAGVLPD